MDDIESPDIAVDCQEEPAVSPTPRLQHFFYSYYPSLLYSTYVGGGIHGQSVVGVPDRQAIQLQMSALPQMSEIPDEERVQYAYQ